MGGGVGEWGDECSVNGGDGETLLSKRSLTSVTTEAGSLFQYFTTPTENADPFLRTLEYLERVPS